MRQFLFILYLIFFMVTLFVNRDAEARVLNNSKAELMVKSLQWVDDPSTHYNLCQGYYRDLAIPYSLRPDKNHPDAGYDISADQTTWKLNGETTLSGNVRVTRPDQELQGDVAFLYPNKQNGKIEDVKMVGNLKLNEPGKLIVAHEGLLHLPDRQITLNQCFYRVALKENKVQEIKIKKTGKVKEKHLYTLTALGSADQIKQEKKGLFDLFQASYTTCPPVSQAWLLKAKKIHLNSNTGRGEAFHSLLYLKGIPACYLPYFNFPIDKRRYSGFLLPSVGSDSDSGFKLSTPFYLNLAPNYDATMTPTWMAKRGLLTEGLFRYLTPYDQGQFQLSFLPNDSAFQDFQQKARTDYATSPSLHRLLDSSNDRRAFSWQDQLKWNDHWTSQVNYNYVGDDYYLQDFSPNLLDSTADQLMRKGQVVYQGQYWNMFGNFQSYQTLHPVNRDIIKNQYGRMPQIQVNSDYGELPGGLDAAATVEYNHFIQSRTPGITPLPVIGDRFNFSPSLSLPWSWPFAYLTPRVQLQVEKYNTVNNPVENARGRGVAIPIVDINGGLNFERNFSFFRRDYRQTLEPRLYYLYVPYRDQDGMPIFDTTAQSSTYDSMFQYNRFSGMDRMGDANQVTAAVMTRFYDSNTGDEKGNLGVGQIRYFRDRKVNLCSGSSCVMKPIDRFSSSPIEAVANYNFTEGWTASANAAWSTQVGDFVNETVAVKYRPNDYHLITANYQWLKGDNQFPGLIENTNNNDLKQTDLAGYWKLNDHWSIMGRWNYNWSYGSIQAFYYGLAYESCCWAIRLVNGRTYLGDLNDTRIQYRDVVYLQLALKGLGKIGEGGDPESLLSQTMNGYVDTFGQDN